MSLKQSYSEKVYLLNTAEAEVYTFWKLIHNYNIQIPIIQRDYVQGLGIPKTKEIRDKFLQQLFSNLHERRPILLDFIYGTTNEVGDFSPLDGQQRLTTLFLLHWYAAMREGKMNEHHELFKKFSYETRQHSKQFFEFLTTIESLDFKQSPITEQIKNEARFFERWLLDPTVKSVLSMLDAIHRHYEQPIFEQLTNEYIKFYFIDLEKFHLEDSLYIKMNARGKPLTTFEIFKAQLQSFLQVDESVSQHDVEHFLIQMDTTWTDLLWQYAQLDYDVAFYQFIKTMLANHIASCSNSSVPIDIILKKNDSALFAIELQLAQVNSAEWMQEMQLFLNTFMQLIPLVNKKILDIKGLFERNLKENVTYAERIQLYSVVLYAKYSTKLDEDSLNKWLRFVRNVTENTLYNNVGEYRSSIAALYRMKDYIDDIESYLISEQMKLEGFYQMQIQQEINKAKLKNLDSNWKAYIEQAEDYPYFTGEVGFLLRFAGVTDSLNFVAINHPEAQEKFKLYFEKATLIFGEKGLTISSTLLSRALLCWGDYLVKIGRNYTFSKDSFDRDYGWKRYLRDENVMFLKNVLDSLKDNLVEKALSTTIKNHSITDWRKDFIDFPEIMEDYCGDNRNIRVLEDGVILLLKTNATNGYCAEYNTYALYLQGQLKGFDQLTIEYIDSVGRDYSTKYILVNDSYGISYNEQKYIIEKYEHLNDEWVYVEDFEDVDKIFSWLNDLNKQV